MNVWRSLVQVQRRFLERELRKYGLKKDDVLKTTIFEDHQKAINALPREEYVARQRRVIRAMDLCLKNKTLNQREQWNYDANHSYLKPLMDKITAKRMEKMGTDYVPKDFQI